MGSGLKHISSEIICWPTGRYLREVCDTFHKMKGMNGCIGAIDGTHINIKGPSFCGENYINRKGYHSMVLQCVVDSKYKFTDCYVGFPGSVHDARVFNNSDLGVKMETDPINIFPDDTFIIGDSAYPLTPHLLTPYKENGYLNETQENYNYVQSATRNIVERAFALLKSRFARLKHVEMNKIEDICLIILSACVLHNYCLEENDFEVDFDVEPVDVVPSFVYNGSSRADAAAKRDRIANDLL